ncbi:MAG: hypothetical protein JWQ03_1333, partial [Variovorax sp.]|nr:hypothetical protein [Variovorax sp.]
MTPALLPAARRGFAAVALAALAWSGGALAQGLPPEV